MTSGDKSLLGIIGIIALLVSVSASLGFLAASNIEREIPIVIPATIARESISVIATDTPSNGLPDSMVGQLQGGVLDGFYIESCRYNGDMTMCSIWKDTDYSTSWLIR